LSCEWQANDSTAAQDLDDLVTRAAEAKNPITGETKSITAVPNVSTVGKEEEKGFDVSRIGEQRLR